MHQHKVETELLVLSAQQGNSDAFTLLFRRHHKSLLQYACKFSGNDEVAKEAVQEAWFAVPYALGELSAHGAAAEAFEHSIIAIEDEDRALAAAIDKLSEDGIASLLLAEDEAARRGHERIWLYTNVKMSQNLVWYPRLGYVETHRKLEKGFERVFFEKRI